MLPDLMRYCYTVQLMLLFSLVKVTQMQHRPIEGPSYSRGRLMPESNIIEANHYNHWLENLFIPVAIIHGLRHAVPTEKKYFTMAQNDPPEQNNTTAAKVRESNRSSTPTQNDSPKKNNTSDPEVSEWSSILAQSDPPKQKNKTPGKVLKSVQYSTPIRFYPPKQNNNTGIKARKSVNNGTKTSEDRTHSYARLQDLNLRPKLVPAHEALPVYSSDENQNTMQGETSSRRKFYLPENRENSTPASCLNAVDYVACLLANIESSASMTEKKNLGQQNQSKIIEVNSNTINNKRKRGTVQSSNWNDQGPNVQSNEKDESQESPTTKLQFQISPNRLIGPARKNKSQDPKKESSLQNDTKVINLTIVKKKPIKKTQKEIVPLKVKSEPSKLNRNESRETEKDATVRNSYGKKRTGRRNSKQFARTLQRKIYSKTSTALNNYKNPITIDDYLSQPQEICLAPALRSEKCKDKLPPPPNFKQEDKASVPEEKDPEPRPQKNITISPDLSKQRGNSRLTIQYCFEHMFVEDRPTFKATNDQTNKGRYCDQLEQSTACKTTPMIISPSILSLDNQNQAHYSNCYWHPMGVSSQHHCVLLNNRLTEYHHTECYLNCKDSMHLGTLILDKKPPEYLSNLTSNFPEWCHHHYVQRVCYHQQPSSPSFKASQNHYVPHFNKKPVSYCQHQPNKLSVSPNFNNFPSRRINVCFVDN